MGACGTTRCRSSAAFPRLRSLRLLNILVGTCFLTFRALAPVARAAPARHGSSPDRQHGVCLHYSSASLSLAWCEASGPLHSVGMDKQYEARPLTGACSVSYTYHRLARMHVNLALRRLRTRTIPLAQRSGVRNRPVTVASYNIGPSPRPAKWPGVLSSNRLPRVPVAAAEAMPVKLAAAARAQVDSSSSAGPPSMRAHTCLFSRRGHPRATMSARHSQANNRAAQGGKND